MGIVAILDENTINKIAAGEVVDRPASIVKELVENAIDADATKIDVEIKNGGISLIKITDNGKGISTDDVRLVFERHATSKIRQESDILHIVSMGFRGEALASVASIAKVCMETKSKDEYTGTKYVIENGKEISFEEIARNTGTTFYITDVFANVPARFKFLKKDYTEAGYIEDVVMRIALINPQIAFKYTNNGKVIFQTNGNNDMTSCVYSLFGKEIASNIEKVEYEYENVKVQGVIGAPTLARSTRQNEYTYVNNRYVKDKNISMALEKAYEQNMLIGKYPYAVLNVQVSPEEVDVNVHPAKLEVKFENESKIFEAVYHATNNALYNYHKKVSPFNHVETYERKINEINASNNLSETTSNYTTNAKDITIDEKISEDTLPNSNKVSQAFKYKDGAYNEAKAIEITEYIMNSPKISETEKEVLTNNTISVLERKYKYVGSVFNTYIIIEVYDKMYVIDQHAAHERVLYEKIKEMYYSKDRQTQMLLIPILVELKESELRIVKENALMFEKSGFVFESFGDNAIKITGVPNIGYDIEYKEMFLDGLDKLMDNVKTINEEKEFRFLATLACKAAIKANMGLTKEEHITLLDEMMKLDKPFTCPHGRPTAYEITKNEIERRFLRK